MANEKLGGHLAQGDLTVRQAPARIATVAAVTSEPRSMRAQLPAQVEDLVALWWHIAGHLPPKLPRPTRTPASCS